MCNKIDVLIKRTIKLLEVTKKEMFKYGKERKTLDCFLREHKNLDEWECFLNKFENSINK